MVEERVVVLHLLREARALDEGELGVVIGKRAGTPEGGAVVVDITGHIGKGGRELPEGHVLRSAYDVGYVDLSHNELYDVVVVGGAVAGASTALD